MLWNFEDTLVGDQNGVSDMENLLEPISCPPPNIAKAVWVYHPSLLDRNVYLPLRTLDHNVLQSVIQQLNLDPHIIGFLDRDDQLHCQITSQTSLRSSQLTQTPIFHNNHGHRSL